MSARAPPADEQLRDGLAVVDKEAGWTSHDVVAKARGILRNKKIGHSGTLDPDATGVLLLGVGRATRLLSYLTVLPKTYTGEIVLGIETDTLDARGEVVATHDMAAVTDEQVRAAAAAHRADPAGAADGLGGQGRRPAAARAGPRGHRGRAGAPPGHGAPLRRRAARRDPAVVCAGRGRVLVGHLRPHPGRRPRPRPRRWSAPAEPAAHRHRLVHPGRGPSAGRPAWSCRSSEVDARLPVGGR